VSESESRPDKPFWTGVAIAGIVLGIIGVFNRPFLFVPIGAILMLIAAKQTASQRITRPGIILISICGVVGAGIAASYSHALY
jgi:hypothetical protein